MTEPLDPDMLAALRKERGAPAPGDARARVAGRLAAILPGVASLTAAHDAPPSAAPTTTGGSAGATSVAHLGVAGTRGLLALTFVLGGAAGAGLHATLASPPPPRIVYVDRAAPVPVPEQPTPTSTPTSTPTATLSPTSTPTPMPTLTAMPTSTPIAYSPAAQLDAERALLDDARHALTHGDAARAVEDLRSHERTYSKPLLGEEHDALTVEALVRARRYDEARARADAFRRKTPGSLFMSAVDAAIASIP
jgi:hypothetical protein